MSTVRACLLACLLPLAATFPGTYQKVTGWPSDSDMARLGPFNKTSGVDVDALTGEVYMCQQQASPHVTVWKADSGKLMRSWDGDLDKPHAIRILHTASGTQVWVADMGGLAPDTTGHTVKIYTPDGKLLRVLGELGKSGTELQPLHFGSVADIAWDPTQSRVLIADGDGPPNNRIVELDGATLKLVRSWGGVGTTQARFNNTHSVAVDSCSRVWVADRENSRVQIFGMDGQWIATWDCFTEKPYGLRVFPGPGVREGMMLVTGGGAGNGIANKLEVVKFGTDCTQPAALGKCAVEYSWEAEVDSTAHFSAIDGRNWDVYTCEISGNKIIKYQFVPNM